MGNFDLCGDGRQGDKWMDLGVGDELDIGAR